MSAAATCLRKAADVLEREGWTQRTYHKPTEGYGSLHGWHHCAEGAIEVAAGTWRYGTWQWSQEAVGREEDARDALAGYFIISGIAPESVPNWNDAEGRTAAEVMAVLRAAADWAEDAL